MTLQSIRLLSLFTWVTGLAIGRSRPAVQLGPVSSLSRSLLNGKCRFAIHVLLPLIRSCRAVVTCIYLLLQQ